MNTTDKAAIGRALQSLRKTHGGGRKSRIVQHDPEARYCTCVDCRKARGHYPAHLIDTQPKAATTPKRPKP